MTDENSQAGEWPPLGVALAAARNAKNLSVKAVSDSLRLSLKQISALESDDFSSLPQPMVTRGFIRNYARLLELDAEPFLDSYRQRVPDNAPTSLNVQTSIPHVQLFQQNRLWLKYAAIFLSLVLMVLFFQLEQTASIGTDDTTDNEVVSTVSLPDAALPPASFAEATDAAVDAGSANLAVSDQTVKSQSLIMLPDAAMSKAGSELVAVKPMAAAKTTVVPESTTGLQLRPSADMKPANVVNTNATGTRKMLIVSVSDKAWVQVKDKSGGVLYEKILSANSSDVLDAQPPLFIWLGNANATSLNYMGQPVDVVSKTFNNIARLTLE